MKPKIELPPVEEVVLPKLFNLRPGYLILGMIILALLILIFLLGFLPGIIKGGRYVSFQAPLSETGILLNGTYLGSATHQYFIPSGTHTVEYVKADQIYATEEINIDHPIFFTWLIHRTKLLQEPTISLSHDQKDTIISFLLNEIQEVSKALEYPPQFPYQPVYKNLFTDLQALEINKPEIITLALSMISNETMREEAEQFFAIEPVKPVQTKINALPPVGKVSTLQAGSLSIEGYTYEGSSITFGDGQTPQSNLAQDSTSTFVLAKRPVSQYEWALFIEENPQWSKSNQNDPTYLAGLSLSTQYSTNRPIFNISYQAALAFVEWLSKKSSKEVFIPTEAMWSQAAYSQTNTVYDASLSLSTNSAPLLGLLGGVWEMTSSHYLPRARGVAYSPLQDLAKQYNLEPQVIVKGGSSIHKSTVDEVGIIEPTSSNEYIGVRIGWYE